MIPSVANILNASPLFVTSEGLFSGPAARFFVLFVNETSNERGAKAGVPRLGSL